MSKLRRRLVTVKATVVPTMRTPAWYGKYRLFERGAWTVACSGYGPILYTSPEAARMGATHCAMRELEQIERDLMAAAEATQHDRPATRNSTPRARNDKGNAGGLP